MGTRSTSLVSNEHEIARHIHVVLDDCDSTLLLRELLYLGHYAGPSADGSGTSPGLILPGLHPPSVSLREYLGSWRIRLEYQVPYFVVALIFSVTGCCIPSWLLSRIPGLSSHPFAGSVVVAMLCLLLGPAIADAGTHLKLWRMPTWFNGGAAWTIRLLIMVFLPLAVLSGVATLIGKKLPYDKREK